MAQVDYNIIGNIFNFIDMIEVISDVLTCCPAVVSCGLKMTWRETVNATRTENPGIPFKEVLKKASETFRTPPEVVPEAPVAEAPKRRYNSKQPPRAETPAA